MLDWYWMLCVHVQPAVWLVIVSCQVCAELGEHAAVHCSEAVMMSPGFTVCPRYTVGCRIQLVPNIIRCGTGGCDQLLGAQLNQGRIAISANSDPERRVLIAMTRPAV